MRVGRIVSVDDFPEARNPSYRLTVDLGEEIGLKKSCAQITSYSKEELLGKQVICVVNFPEKQIANAKSEVLILGLPHPERTTILLSPDCGVPCGGRVY